MDEQQELNELIDAEARKIRNDFLDKVHMAMTRAAFAGEMGLCQQLHTILESLTWRSDYDVAAYVASEHVPEWAKFREILDSPELVAKALE